MGWWNAKSGNRINPMTGNGHLRSGIPAWNLGRREPVVERFWKYVEKTDTCWLWTGAKDGGGYGVIGMGGVGGKDEKAHRLSYMIHKGPIPDGKLILHSCDNPPCVNPAHLDPGTLQKNAEDRAIRGRQTRKLQPAQIVQIRKLIKAGMRLTSIANQFGVHATCILAIRDGRTWKHVA